MASIIAASAIGSANSQVDRGNDTVRIKSSKGRFTLGIASLHDYLSNPDQLARIGDRLCSIRGESGAARKIAELVCEEVDLQP